ncbi:MAG: sulfatase-like hydrolase/transferase [Halomonas sp.]|nr:sulfatase-like hydrolase/transferase [Halomonas sp.]MDN6298391.1 sulfatase-like hydrolase/transferase [Halomonas sp.]MDN6315673.1 sulfatase-like hydrolase/transferase [Halomonas sp.]MDN6337008.1 sulfatase-like hydrolase/transferase [Halomonas sp.]
MFARLQPAFWLPTTALGLGLGYTLITLTRLPWWTLFGVAVLAGLLGARLTKSAPADGYRRIWPWSLVPLCLWGLYVYLADSFGNVDLGAVFFHLQAGITDHGGSERIVAAGLYTLSMLGLLCAFTWLVRRHPHLRRIEPLVAVALLVSNPLLFGLGQRSAAVVTDDDGWLDQHYQKPVIQAQDNPPNLLILYLESLERTYGEPAFGDTYDDLRVLGEKGVVFEGIEQINNTGWTMAGMIGSQCGTPLMPAGLVHDRQFEPLAEVVPGVECLGDLLDEQGYRLSFLGGASKAFAGKGRFYEGHGFDNVLGLSELQPRLDTTDYVNDWGLYDDTLYDLTAAEIKRLKDRGDGPWGVVNISLSAHAPTGFPARSCRKRQGEWDGEDILYSVKCSAWLARTLVERLAHDGLLDNTLVVLASDHLSMRVSVWDELVGLPRENTLILLGNGLTPRHISRRASIVDLFPTILDAMGYPPKYHQAGLGVSLLQPDTHTLLERYGKEKINARLLEDNALQHRLWEGLAPQRREDQAPLHDTPQH